MKININNTKFLNTTEDLKHKDTVTLVDGGRWEESTRFKKKDGTPSNSFKIKLKLINNEVREATLNWGNVKLLVKAFGDESENWVEKEVRAWKTKSEKAKTGFTFIFVPIDWTRNDMGVWEDGEGKEIELDEVKQEPSDADESGDTIEYPEDDINPDDIPF